MSILSRLLGGTFEECRAEAEELLAGGSWGEARLAFERALRKGRRAEPAELEAIRERIAGCRLELARARLREADQLSESGDPDLAIETLEEALEVCDDDEIAAGVEERKRRYEAREARRLVEDADEMSEDELLAVIAGTWSESQADEYAALPDEFREALLVSHDGNHDEAAERIRRVVEETPEGAEAIYARFELGRELSAAGRDDDAVEALEEFRRRAEGREVDLEVRLAALSLLGGSLAGLERHGQAERALREAVAAAPDNHMPLLNLGVYLRSRGEDQAALEALNGALERMGQMHPDFRVLRELGFTHLELGNDREAEEHLYSVIEHQASRGEHERFDPAAAVALAGLYEKRGEQDRAADLYRHLAVGHDSKNHFFYNLQAARLLKNSGGDPAVIERCLARAVELAETEQQRNALAELESPESDS
jgi:tetratricopeptide (TPR) repeat protein